MLKRVCGGVRAWCRWLTLIVIRGRGTPEELRRAAEEINAPPPAAEALRTLSDALARRGFGDVYVGIEACVAIDRDTAVGWGLSIALSQRGHSVASSNPIIADQHH